AGAGRGAAVGNRDHDHVDGLAAVHGIARRGPLVVQVLMAGAVTEYASGQREQGERRAVAPVDDHRVRVERARVDERPADRGRVSLVDGVRAGAGRRLGRAYVGDGDADAGRGQPIVVVGHGGRDRVDAGAAGAVVQILVGGAKTEDAGGQSQ